MSLAFWLSVCKMEASVVPLLKNGPLVPQKATFSRGVFWDFQQLLFFVSDPSVSFEESQGNIIWQEGSA